MKKQVKQHLKKQLRKPAKKSYNRTTLYGTEGRNWT